MDMERVPVAGFYKVVNSASLMESSNGAGPTPWKIGSCSQGEKNEHGDDDLDQRINAVPIEGEEKPLHGGSDRSRETRKGGEKLRYLMRTYM